MRIISRGFRSFRRNPVRNSILVVLLSVCLTFSMSMLAVKLAADSQLDKVKRTVGNYGEVKVSSAYMMKRFEAQRKKSSARRAAEARSMTAVEELASRAEDLVPEEVTDAFSKQVDIKTYDKVLETNAAVNGIVNTSIQRAFQLRESMGQGQGPGGARMSASGFYFMGNTNGASAADFTTGAKKLIKGRHFTYEDCVNSNPVVVVEKTLAEENKLDVGDKVQAQIRGASGAGAGIELEISGIYETVRAESGQNAESGEAAFNPAGNAFYAPLSIVQKLNSTPGYVRLGSYYFGSVDDTDALEAAFKSAGGDKEGKYEFVTDLADYQEIADPLMKARNTSVVGLSGTLAACALIILLAMFIIVSGRTREMGILKAIGSTDRQVIGQFAVEVTCVCLVAIMLAMGATALIGQSMGDWLLPETERQTAEARGGGPGGPGGPGGLVLRMGDRLYKEGSRFSFNTAGRDDKAAKLNVVYRGSLFLYGMLILVGLSLAGMTIPVFWIIRLRPARVLSME